MSDELDGCDLDFDDPASNTTDGDVDALVMFAGVQFDDPTAVEEQRRRLAAWGEAVRGSGG